MLRNRLLSGLAACFLVAVVGVPAVLAADRPKLEGLWDTPAGRMEIKRDGNKVTGVLTSPGPDVALKRGTQVLQGTYDDDTLAGELRVGVVLPTCGAAEDRAYVMLLVGKSGKLTGSVTTQVPCAAAAQTIAFQRAPQQSAAARNQNIMLGPPPEEGMYDPRGRRAMLYSNNVKALMRDAEEYMKEGQWERARGQLLKAIKLDAHVGEAFNGVGVTYFARRDYNAAIDWYKKGLEAAPGFGDLYYNLACAYAQLDKKAMSLRYLKLSALKGYDAAENLDKDPDLEPLRGDPIFDLIKAVMKDPSSAQARLELEAAMAPPPPPPLPPDLPPDALDGGSPTVAVLAADGGSDLDAGSVTVTVAPPATPEAKPVAPSGADAGVPVAPPPPAATAAASPGADIVKAVAALDGGAVAPIKAP